MGFESGVITEESLRNDVIHAMFRSEIGRDYWAEVGPVWPQMASYSRRTRRFLKIVDEECTKAAMAGPPPVARSDIQAPQQQSPVPASPTNWPATVCVALGLGLAMGVAIRRKPT